MPDPLSVCVVEPVGKPLGLQQLVSLHVQEQRLPSLQFSILLPKGVKVDGTPDASTLAPDYHNSRRVDSQERSSASPTVNTVPNRLMHHISSGGSAARLTQAHHHPAEEAESGFFRNLLTHCAHSLVVELKDGVVVARQPEKLRLSPTVVH